MESRYEHNKMVTHVNRVQDIRDMFVYKFKNRAFEDDGMLELLGISFIADEDRIFGKPNEKYQQAELHWYNSMRCNTDKLQEIYGMVPAIWQDAANSKGSVNSNYGYLVHSALNGSQFDNVYRELKKNPNSRRGTMIYTHPDMHQRHREHGKDDFVCTNAVTYYIKECMLYAVVQMRSNDVVFGYMNDLYWQKAIQAKLAGELMIKSGTIMWQVQSLHVYPRHHKLIEEYIKPVDYAMDTLDIGAHDG